VTDEGWIKAEREHEREMADIKFKNDYRQREALTTRIGFIAWALGAVGVVAILALLIYNWQADSGERGMELEQACIEAGGTWTQIGGSQSKMCVHIDGVER
jgi:hypothetical protein